MDNTPEPMPLFEDDSAESSANTPPADPPPATPAEEPAPQPPSSEDASKVTASVASHAVASVDEVDAWLAGRAEPGTTGWMSTDAEAEAAMAAWIAADPKAVPAEKGPVVVTSGRVDRMRPTRRPLVPRWALWAILAVLIVGGLTAGTFALLASRSRVLVPTVAGLQTPEARERLATVGLKLTVSDRRFSTLPVDTILAQTPEAGGQLKRGATITVVVSAGTEEFTMPDVVGEGLSLARSQLEEKGLEVQIEPQPSDQPSDTVLASNPAAGSLAHTGDIVRLTVAQNATGVSTTPTSSLVPFTMNGVRITLDPAPPVAGQPDSALEVARRLQSLLQASGATVRATRSAADTGTVTSATARQLRAREGSPTASVGFDVISSGAAGIAVTYPSSTAASGSAGASQMLSSQISSALAGQAVSVRQASGGSDVVLSVTSAPYVRLTLGSTASREDLANFRDPNWADKIARAIYQGIASIYGVRN